jgi:hypothetical protein
MYYFRAMVLQGRAIALLTDVGPAEIAYTNLRTLFEHYIDFRYLLAGDDAGEKERKARRILLYAMRDLTQYSAGTGFDPEAIKRMQQSQLGVMSADPELAAALEREWRKRPHGHWSGMTRRAVMLALDSAKDGLVHHYKLYSWKTHGVIGPLTDVSPTPEITRHADSLGHNATGRFLCRQAIGMLLDAWRGIRHQGSSYLPSRQNWLTYRAVLSRGFGRRSTPCTPPRFAHRPNIAPSS